jgi:hypothetical protein
MHYESERVLGSGLRGFQTSMPKWAESNCLNCYLVPMSVV